MADPLRDWTHFCRGEGLPVSLWTDVGGPEVAVRSGSAPSAGRPGCIAIWVALMSGWSCGLAVFLRVGGGKLEWEHRVIACRCCCACLLYTSDAADDM
eukprot:9352719-Alexandrium_andersonii.AAC.1